MSSDPISTFDPAPDAALRPFLSAVTNQVAFALGADPDAEGGDARVRAAEQRALAVLRDAGGLGEPSSTERVDDAARRLLAEPAMLAAFFQNLDLLFEHRAPGSEAVALLLMRAMEL